MRKRTSVIAWAVLAAAPLLAEPSLPAELEGVGIVEQIGQSVDPSLSFTNEDGHRVELGSFLHKGRPVLLNLVYYTCPMLCNLLLNGQTNTLRAIPWTPGEQFEIVTISIDPTETPILAGQKKRTYLASYGRPAPGWHFLVDPAGNAKKLAEQVGFHYRYDERQRQYAHAAAIMILTPEGQVSRYLYGAQFKARDLRMALTEASAGKTGGVVDRLLLFCFHYDSQARSYVLFATNFMRAGGVAMVLVLGGVLMSLWRKEKASA